MDFVVVALGNDRLGLPAEDVRSFARLLGLAPLPGAPACVDGCATIDGVALPVLDLRAAVGLPARPPAPGDALVVAVVGDRRAALRVDVALGFATYDEGDALPPRARLIADLASILPAPDARRLDEALRRRCP